SKRSIWSKVNTEKVAALIASDRMRLAGLAEVDRAKADGRWETAYAAQSKAEVPEDLQAFLDAHPDAAAFFATLTSQNRFAFLFRLHNAKKPETRARRLAEFTRMLRAGETFY
ncbi:MAG TPA: YdeI/OmpD-associated family protein, partial [Holophagaceae bacterium]|nr:YdeI/OmpD-associated family protein [Holophagaceae bacterium]